LQEHRREPWGAAISCTTRQKWELLKRAGSNFTNKKKNKKGKEMKEREVRLDADRVVLPYQIKLKALKQLVEPVFLEALQ
jgi:hypothetical protein